MADDGKSDPPASGGSSFGKTLTEKIGGVPVWGIGVGLALLIIGVIWYRNKVAAEAAATNAADTTSADGTTADDTSSVNGNPIDEFLSSDPTNSAYPVGLTAQGTPAPITNAQWSRLALDELIAKGDDPTLVSNALSKYLSGETLSAAEQGIVNLALQVFGAPPEGVIPVSVSTGGTTTPPVVPPTQPGMPSPVHLPVMPPVLRRPPKKPPMPVKHPGERFVTVVPFTSHDPAWNATFSGIAEHEHLTIEQLKKLNPGIKNIDIIHPDQRIRVA